MSNANILAIADEETLSVVVPSVIERRANYYVRREDTTIVSGTARYRISSRALAATTRHVALVDANGNESPVIEEQYENRGQYAGSTGFSWPRRAMCVIEGDEIVLLPTPNTSGLTLRVSYEWRPGRLVEASAACLVTGITQPFSYATVYAGPVPATWTTSDRFDFIESRPNFDLLLRDQTATSISSGSSLTLNNDLADEAGIAVGVRSLTKPDMYITLTGETPVLQVPDTLQSVVYMLTTSRVLRDLGRHLAADKHLEAASSKLRLGLKLLTPRNRGKTRKAVDWSTALRWGRR